METLAIKEKEKAGLNDGAEKAIAPSDSKTPQGQVAPSAAGTLYQTPRVIKVLDSGLDTVVVVLILIALLFSGFAMWDADNMHSNAMSDQYAIYNPSEDPLSFEELRAINPDVFGWITIYGTLIDFPLVQTDNNNFYQNHSVMREFSPAGAIFLDVDNDRNFTDFNSLIHGHHMAEGAMFGNIDLFVSQEFFDSHKYGNLFFNDKDHGLEFFAFIQTSGYNWQIFNAAISDPIAQAAYLDIIYENSIHYRDIGVTTNDNIVLLATCTNNITNGRHLLAAKIHDEPFENPFAQGDLEIRERQDFVDSVLLPFTRTFCIPLLIAAIIFALSYWTVQKRRRWKIEDQWMLMQKDQELLKKLGVEDIVSHNLNCR